MLRTPLVEMLGIDHPIIQAGMGRYGSGAALAAAVSEAGAIGTIGAAKRSPDDLRNELAALGDLTERPFIVNFTRAWLDLYPACLDVALAAQPRAVSLSVGLPGDLVPRIHDHGALVIVQVQTVERAKMAADEGVDIIIAQGAEAGGYGHRTGGMVLVPQVVDALAPLPVVAAGGISDGRGLAAFLLLGAAGANIGTRFLASVEASMSDEWKQRLVEAPSDETVSFDAAVTEGPPAVSAAGVPVPIALSRRDTESYVDHPSLGQGASAIRSIETAADIVAELVRGAEEALRRSGALVVERAKI